MANDDTQSGAGLTARRGPVDAPALLLGLTAAVLALWATYSLNGFRGWWVPIKLSDDDAGAALRQVLFAGSAVVSVGVLYAGGLLWRTLRRHWPLIALVAWISFSTLYSELPSLTAKRSILLACGTTMMLGVVAVARDPIGRITAAIIRSAAS